MILTPTNIALVIYQVGGWGPGPFNAPASDTATRSKVIAWLDTAIAVCLAESEGDTEAKNKSSSASGMWQIMVSVHGDKIKAAEAKFQAKAKNPKDPLTNIGTISIFNPYVNTEVAKQVYSERSGWTPWKTFTNGAYRSHTGHGQAAYTFLADPKNKPLLTQPIRPGLIAPDPTLGDLVNGGIVNPITGAVDKSIKALRDAGITVGVFILGILLLALGVWFLISQNMGKVAKLTPQGALAEGLLKPSTVPEPEFRGRGGKRFASETGFTGKPLDSRARVIK